MHDFEAETADQICAAESEVASLRARVAELEAELAAIDRALAGEPVPPDAPERVVNVAGWRAAFYASEGRVAGLSYERHIVRAEVRRLGGDPDALPRAGGPWALEPGYYGPAGDRLAAEQAADQAAWEARKAAVLRRHAEQAARNAAPAPEDDGLTDADRAAGWRWETAGRTRHLRAASGELVAAVDDDGWSAHCGGKGPATDAFGQCRAVAHLRKAGVLPGGEG